MKVMSSGGNLGKSAGYSVEQERDLQRIEREMEPGSGSAQAVENPVRLARNQVDTIENTTDLLGENCELVMSDEAYRPATMARLGSR
jgi:hypothetical protein